LLINTIRLLEDIMDFRLRTLTLASAIGALGLASVVTPVYPREKGVHGRHAVNANKNRHCVTDLSKPNTPATCYDTFTAAIAAATGGRITDAPADSRVAMNDERLLARVYNTGDTRKEKIQTDDKKKGGIQPRIFGIIGTIFYQSDFESSSATWSAESCDDTTSIDWQVAYVGDDWNDDFESARGGNNCQMKVFEHRDFQGASSPWFWESAWLGVLQDEGSSLQFR
jgi:hypothetical protein